MKTSTVPVVLIVFLSAWLYVRANLSPTTPHRGFVDVDGSQLYYEECSVGAKAVVLLHDGVVNSAVWDDVWPALFRERRKAVNHSKRLHTSLNMEPVYMVPW